VLQGNGQMQQALDELGAAVDLRSG
jgi:hypothetical protein